MDILEPFDLNFDLEAIDAAVRKVAFPGVHFENSSFIVD